MNDWFHEMNRANYYHSTLSDGKGPFVRVYLRTRVEIHLALFTLLLYLWTFSKSESHLDFPFSPVILLYTKKKKIFQFVFLE